MKRAHFYKLSFITGLLIWAVAGSLAQNPPRSFKETFNKETRNHRQHSQYGNFRNLANLSFFPDTLPDWFFQPPASGTNRVYAIGISDPDLCPEQAFLQAYYRARVMAVLFNTSRIEYFRDVFTATRHGIPQRSYRQRFDTYFRISANEVADSTQFHIIEQHLTRYNESLVLLAYSPSRASINETTSISAMASVLYIEAQVGDAFEPQASYDLITEIHQPAQHPQRAEFNSIRKGHREATYSLFLDKEITFPLFVYRYCNPSWEPYTKPMVSYNGLWSVFIQHMLKHLTLTTEQSNLRLRSMGQQSEPEATDLTREIAAQTARIHLISLDFSAEDIIFNMWLEPLD